MTTIRDLARRRSMQHAPGVRSSRRSPVLVVVALLGLALLLGGCASDAPLDTLDPQGPEAQSIDNLAMSVFAAAAVVFVVVEVGLVYLLIRFRRRGDEDDDDELPEQTHGVLKLELGWTIVPTMILGVVAVGTMVTFFDLADRPADALEVSVTGQQWWWEFGYDIDGDGEADFVTPNEMVIPADVPVNVDITSRDVIHSFWIPALNGKMDAVPGRNSPLTLQADDPGIYWGQCTEYCGLSHANMRMRVVALDPRRLRRMAGQPGARAADGAALTGEAAAGRDLFTSQCSTCHLVDGVNDEETVRSGRRRAVRGDGRAGRRDDAGLQRRHRAHRVGVGTQPHPHDDPQHVRGFPLPHVRRIRRGRHRRPVPRSAPGRRLQPSGHGGLAAESAGREAHGRPKRRPRGRPPRTSCPEACPTTTSPRSRSIN